MRKVIKVFPVGKRFACGGTKFEIEATFDTFQDALRYANGRNQSGLKKGQLPLINL